jgi:glycosyltransferase involved in cell wall biosynthesis
LRTHPLTERPIASHDGDSRLRVLAVTRIFPNRLEPLACAFNRQQLKALSRRAHVEVMAVVPYLAFASLLGDRTRPGRLARLPKRDEIDGLPVVHPRAPYLPGGGALFAPVNAPLYLAGLLPYARALRGRFDVVLGAYLYPDGCAAALLAQLLGVPYALKGHGTDVNLVAGWRTVRPLLRLTLERAGAAIGVSRPMVERLVELGAPRERAVLVENGVDRDTFQPRDKREARRELGLPEDANVIVFVGRLEKEKGAPELVDALRLVAQRRSTRQRPPVHLVFVGDGSLRRELERHAQHLANAPAGEDVGARVRLAGPKPLEEVARHLAAADLLALPSWAEGTPNVVLEALAAGRPVVATRVGGIPDVVHDGETGLLVPPHDVSALAAALDDALERSWDEARIAASAPPSWDASAGHLFDVLAEAAASARASGAAEAA